MAPPARAAYHGRGMEPIFYVYLLAGFALLWKGGDLLVDGADAFARSHGVPPTLADSFS